jgi:hypothetical protein
VSLGPSRPHFAEHFWLAITSRINPFQPSISWLLLLLLLTTLKSWRQWRLFIEKTFCKTVSEGHRLMMVNSRIR